VDVEHDGAWSWKQLGSNVDSVFEVLRSLEASTWTEIRNASGGRRGYHHGQPVETLSKEAQARLTRLGLDELDELFRFRVGGTGRLWGIVQGQDFFFLWWDPDHKVAPTKKRNT
jgi:hypothetical protein